MYIFKNHKKLIFNNFIKFIIFIIKGYKRNFNIFMSWR